MRREEAEAFARRWVEHWNAQDVEAVLSHFADGARFTSPKAAATVGAATLSGKDAVRAYWRAAVARIETLRFTLDRVLWDEGRSELAIIYDAAIDGQRNRACELLRFDGAGRVVEGEAMYGAVL